MDTELLHILACPKCRGTLSLVPDSAGEPAGLDCAACAVVYPIDEGIPVLLTESAIPHAEWYKTKLGLRT